MSPAQRTVNPLHFEDLEPHRFEDLVRQLAYRFRSWRYLEATGRLGRDQGVDIRGVEMVTLSESIREVEPVDDIESVEDQFTPPVLEDREWRIQCKRYKEIGPKLMREVVNEAIPDPYQAPYGLIIAAACDVSAETIAVFRQEAILRGVSEFHLWTKAHLEDLLFQPENDHLLFAYFGLSLTVRRRSEVQRVRELLTTKRKVMRALKQTSTAEGIMEDVLIRDIADRHYPSWRDIPEFHNIPCPPWHEVVVEYFFPGGVAVSRYGYYGWVKEDGSWDILESSRRVLSQLGHEYWRKVDDEVPEDEPQQRFERGQLLGQVPKQEFKNIRELWLLPYAHILEVDPVGDLFISGPHLYCRYDGDRGPYRGERRFFTNRWGTDVYELDVENRKPLFATLEAELLAASQDSKDE